MLKATSPPAAVISEDGVTLNRAKRYAPKEGIAPLCIVR